MTSRREWQKLARRDRILRAARRLIAEHGFDSIGMADIARASGLAVGTLYNYFSAKPDLLLALGRRIREAQIEAGDRILEDRPAAPAEAFARLFAGYAEPVLTDRRTWLEMAARADRRAPQPAPDTRLLAQIESLVESQQQRGTLAPEPAKHRAVAALYNLYLGWITASTAGDATTAACQSALRPLLDDALTGLLPRSG